MARTAPQRDHEVYARLYTAPAIAIDPTKDFRGRVQDVIDWITTFPGLPLSQQKEITTYSEGVIPTAVPESDPELMARRFEVLQYQVRDAGESLIDTGSRNGNMSYDQYRLAYMFRLMNVYKVMRFALIFHDPRRSIRRLPRDIVSLILDLAMEGTDSEDNYRWVETLARICSICKAWRDVMTSRRRYWTRITSVARAQPFLPAQLRILSQFDARIQVDLSLHPKGDLDNALTSATTQQRADRMKSLLTQLAEALAPQAGIAAPGFTYFSRTVRLRLWTNTTEWKVLSAALKILRRSPAPELREIDISLVDTTRHVMEKDAWTPYLGSVSLEVLRIRGVGGLWAWPSSPLQAPAHAHLRLLELHSLGLFMPQVRELYHIFLGATQLHTLRLYASALRHNVDDALVEPVHLLHLRELSFNAILPEGIRALLKVFRCPHLDRIELRDIKYSCDGSEFLTQGTLMECHELEDLRLADLAFDGDFDMRQLIGHYPRLRHIQIEDVKPRVLRTMESAVLDKELTPNLEYWRFDYDTATTERDGRGEEFDRVYYSLEAGRPDVKVVNASTNWNQVSYGKPWPDWTKAVTHQG